MKIPNFFIIGGPKWGTTAMWTYLETHPAWGTFLPRITSDGLFENYGSEH
ncbi:MAG: hypothetical protein ACUVTW_14485 [Thermogutta sp.]